MTLADRLQAVKQQIEETALRSGRNLDEIQLIAVSKGQPADMILEAVLNGLRVFGENRIQESLAKMADSRLVEADLEWHMIGRLQTNKIRYLHLDNQLRFRLIHSLDRLQLAEDLSKRMADQGCLQPVLLQVNVSGEKTKAGIPAGEAEGFLRIISRLPGLEVQGLMTIAPLTEDAEQVRPLFRALNRLAADLRKLNLPHCSLEHLSMGMSNDFRVAIEEGATMIRLGRSLFGPRE